MYFRARPAGDRPDDIAFDATLRNAAIHQRDRAQERQGKSIVIRSSDLMNKIRRQRTSNLILFLVDLSWSMAVSQRMAAAKGAIISILTNAYQKRDSVGLITFQKDQAEIVLQPTRSVMLAERSMKKVMIGGKTPLTAGLVCAHNLLKKEKSLRPETSSLLIVLTDGAGNVSLYGREPAEESEKAAKAIAADGFRSVVINTESITFDDGMANQLAQNLNAPCYLIANLKADKLYKTIEKELRS